MFAQHLVIGPEADAQMGFVTREDIRRNEVFGRVTLRPRLLGLRSVEVYAGGLHIDSLSTFDLSDTLPVPVGEYDLEQAAVSLRSSEKRAVSGEAFWKGSQEWDGRIRTVGGSLALRPGRHLSLSGSLEHTRAELPSGASTAYLASGRVAWAFTTRLVAGAFVQWNSLDHNLITNVRVGFIRRPGSDLFVVFNDEHGSKAEPGELVARTFAIKLTWLVRL